MVLLGFTAETMDIFEGDAGEFCASFLNNSKKIVYERFSYSKFPLSVVNENAKGKLIIR